MSNDLNSIPAVNPEPGKEPEVIRVGLDKTNAFLALVGASSVVGVFAVLNYIGGIFMAIMPVVLGGTLFAAIIGSFFFLLRLLKNMRQKASMRLSTGEIFTGVAVLTVMGYFATACMQIFTATGNPLVNWTNGTVAAAGFVACYGLGHFLVELWNGDKR